MKRTAQNQEMREIKRVRREEPGGAGGHDSNANDLFDPSLERRLADLSTDGTDDTGFLHGLVRMKWPPSSGKLNVLMTLADASSQCNVYFSGACSKYLHLLKFNIGDEFQLSLHGVVVESTNDTKCTLRFERGAIVKFVKARNPGQTGQIVNTWDFEKQHQSSAPRGQQESGSDDWYATPVAPPHFASLGGNGSQVVYPQARASTPQTKNSFRPAAATTSDDYIRPAPTSSALAGATSGRVTAAEPVSLGDADTRPRSPLQKDAEMLPNNSSIGAGSSKANSTRLTPPGVPSHDEDPAVEKEARSKCSDQIRSRTAARDAHPRINPPPKKQSKTVQPPPPPPPVPAPETVMSSESVTRNKKKEKREKKALRRELRESADQAQNVDALAAVSPSTRHEELQGEEPKILGVLSSAHTSDDAVASARDNPTRDKPLSAPSSLKAPVVSLAETLASFPPVVESSLNSRPPGKFGGSVVHTARSRSLRSPSSVAPSTSVHGADSRATSISNPSVPPFHAASPSHTITLKTENENTTTSMVAGLYAGDTRYIPLSEVTTSGKLYNMIGIVAAADGVSRTSTSEYKRTMMLVDPSNIKGYEFSVTLFQKIEGRLPEPKRGDILLLRRIMGDEYQGNYCGTGRSYKSWAWSIFDPRKGELCRAADKKAINMINFQPGELELEYCVRLDDWWRAVRPEADANVTVHRIAEMSVRGRIHRLIRDASPNTQPNGFFDCTVEVLHGYMNPANNNQVYSLYVTDYTHNPSMSAVQQDWCPPELADKVLGMEMWGEAAELGSKMKAGEYYFMGNSRMKISGSGYLEGTISEARKIRKLDEDMLEGEPHLEALLGRKTEWEAKVESGGSDFPHLLLEQAEENRFFRCTVEIMSISHKDDFSYLYVTDYTSRSDLVAVAPTAVPSAALKNCVLKIWLVDGQIATSKSLESGDFISIHNLRLKPSGTTHLLAGRLGGNQRLIRKLQPRESANADVKALLCRKTEWESFQGQAKGKNGSTRSKRKGLTDITEKTAAGLVSNVPVVPIKSQAESFATIIALQASQDCPATFRIRARIIDFYPAELRKFTLLRCTKCGEDIPETHRICTECDDAMVDNSFVRPIYQFFFDVEDDEGTQLKISASDGQCSLLKDLAPMDFTTDDDALEVFTKRLAPLLGNLMEVRDGVAQRRFGNEIVVPDTPALALTVGSWPLDDGLDSSARGYIMLDHAVHG